MQKFEVLTHQWFIFRRTYKKNLNLLKLFYLDLKLNKIKEEKLEKFLPLLNRSSSRLEF